uniref:Uncharacterized protein n=1 Tax=mine drainage metagenome TaxID=410659 RepID=E6PMP0_9ZZZZ
MSCKGHAACARPCPAQAGAPRRPGCNSVRMHQPAHRPDAPLWCVVLRIKGIPAVKRRQRMGMVFAQILLRSFQRPIHLRWPAARPVRAAKLATHPPRTASPWTSPLAKKTSC